ncbi:GNAT family N-acetyltransferase [Microbacterium sp.]|uniref:GNAT family N-acetyltransferase n=1 Tax=Microbacterium sp. TaxID=51671 RepID=UPI0028110091|nr:GNAT family N-acetyltransferase [Microbacterium sp.]
MPTPVEITRVDPFDDDAVNAWWHAYAAAKTADMGEHATRWSLEETRSELQQHSEVVDRRAYLATAGGRVVGSGSLALMLKDNRHLARLGVTVPPAHRRRGIGTALLQHIEAVAASEGRTTLAADTSWPASAPADGSGQPGREFARRHGYDIALGDLQSRLRLPVDDRVISELLDESAAASAGYSTRSWVGPVPDELVAAWAVLDSSLDTEAPTGDLDLEATAPDVADIRESEELIATQGRTSFGTVALTSDGQVAAYTQIVISRDDGNAFQWGTLVRREDRGHRLGLRVKLENLRMLQRHTPLPPQIYTFNADSNTHMLAVNRRLGFEPVGRMAELQKRTV